MSIIFIFKKALLEEAKVLVAKGQLTKEKDVFYVGFWELYEAVQNNKSLVDLVGQRKEKKHMIILGNSVLLGSSQAM